MKGLPFTMSGKFEFCCWDCGNQVIRGGLGLSSRCERCKANIIKIEYPQMTGDKFISLFQGKGAGAKGLWRYYDVLPISSRAHIITDGEGDVPIERWEFLERFAREHGHINCTVFVHRHDRHPATGSFKDLSASLVASALKEQGIKEYVVASAGNIGVAFARYLAISGSTLYVFIPQATASFKEAEIACLGQNVFRVKGDYAATKALAHHFAAERQLLLAGGTFDPFRIEAKKTLAFEWYRMMKTFPDVYIQALSGGTGPLGVYKGSQELLDAELISKLPKMLLVQSEKCAPMAHAWHKAKKAGFPHGWNSLYEIIDNPQTEILTLATGNPEAYPRLAKIVYKTKGDIFTLPERMAPLIAQVVAYEAGICIGPAGAVGVGGFFSALKRRLISEGDVVVIALGEGLRRDPDFMAGFLPRSQAINNIRECDSLIRAERQKARWRPLLEYHSRGSD